MSQLSRIALIIAMNVLMYVLAEEFYSDRFDYVDVEAILHNDIHREEYYKCYLKTGPCDTEEQKAITGMFSEAIQTKCKKCTETQKRWIKLVKEWYTKNEPHKWQLIVAKSIEDMKQKNANR